MGRGSPCQIPREGQGGRQVGQGRRDLLRSRKAKGQSWPWLEDQTLGVTPREPGETEVTPATLGPSPSPSPVHVVNKNMVSECWVQLQLAV